MESLVSLARDYNCTVVFTIHQPCSNIVSLFDQLVLLAAQKLVYSGEFSKCQDYFLSIGQPCPPGFNIADFLSTYNLILLWWIEYWLSRAVDLAMRTSAIPLNSEVPSINVSPTLEDHTNLGDEECGLPIVPHTVPLSVWSILSNNLDDDSSMCCA